MPAGDKTFSMTFRLNLDNEQHYRVYKMLMELNPDIIKSKNQFLIDAADNYFKQLNEDSLNETHEENAQCRVLVDEAYKQEIKDMARDEILHMLGAVIAGKESAAGLYVAPAQNVSRASTENLDKPQKGITDQEALNLIDQWG